MQELPQGRKSRVEILPDGSKIKKTYNENGAPAEKYRREVGFYIHYGESDLIPRLIRSEMDRNITIERITGQRLADQLPLPREEMKALADDYIQKLVELFTVSTGIDSKTKEAYYGGLGVEDNVALVLAGLDRLGDQYDGNPIIADLRSSVAQIELDEELLIKLDWNPGNVIFRHGRIHKFIDFEQAFVGTKAILAGILLHNPIWPAVRIFRGLKDGGFIKSGVRDFRKYISYGFAAVLVDSIDRRGGIWAPERLESAFERHVTARYSEIAEAM